MSGTLVPIKISKLWVPRGTGYRGNFRKNFLGTRWVLGTEEIFEKKLFGTDGYRVPTKF